MPQKNEVSLLQNMNLWLFPLNLGFRREAVGFFQLCLQWEGLGIIWDHIPGPVPRVLDSVAVGWSGPGTRVPLELTSSSG